MNANDKIPPQTMNLILEMASKQFGKSKEEILRMVQNKEYEQLLSNVKKEDAKNITNMLSQDNRLAQLLASPQLQEFLNKLK